MKPIIFNTDMVRAILDGRKTQTRRVIPRDVVTKNAIASIIRGGELGFTKCPYGQVGSKLWVRETWVPTFQGLDCLYKADETGKPSLFPVSGWKPSIHMPRWASRITLEITEVRVERLQEISEEDAIAEGIPPFAPNGKVQSSTIPCKHFSTLWDSLNAKRGYGWETNPWVWVISFRRA